MNTYRMLFDAQWLTLLPATRIKEREKESEKEKEKERKKECKKEGKIHTTFRQHFNAEITTCTQTLDSLASEIHLEYLGISWRRQQMLSEIPVSWWHFLYIIPWCMILVDVMYKVLHVCIRKRDITLHDFLEA